MVRAIVFLPLGATVPIIVAGQGVNSDDRNYYGSDGSGGGGLSAVYTAGAIHANNCGRYGFCFIVKQHMPAHEVTNGSMFQSLALSKYITLTFSNPTAWHLLNAGKLELCRRGWRWIWIWICFVTWTSFTHVQSA